MQPGRRELVDGVAALGLVLPDQSIKCLLDYLELMERWNQRINLTAINDPVQRVVRHLLDSLSILPHLPQGRILDLGTGAGLPGIPLAIADPSSHWTLLDSSVKRISFLRVVITRLGIKNVELVHSRIEDYQPNQGFDAVVTRAFASLSKMADNAERLLVEGGSLLAMKGKAPHTEITELDPGRFTVELVELQVPHLDEARHLVKLKRSES